MRIVATLGEGNRKPFPKSKTGDRTHRRDKIFPFHYFLPATHEQHLRKGQSELGNPETRYGIHGRPTILASGRGCPLFNVASSVAAR